MRDLACIDGATERAYIGPAECGTAANFREHLRRWLGVTVELDADRVADIVLAAYEAMANCAEHAYRDSGVQAREAAMTLDMSHDPAEDVVRICVTDRGRWIDAEATTSTVGGRGLLLMRGLADECAVQGRSDGTTVCLQFYRCPALDRTA